jgi:IS30 family transposase
MSPFRPLVWAVAAEEWMARSSYVQLDLDDRRRLYRLRTANTPVPEIARLMGRHRSTIYRELGRNTFEDDEVPQASGYSPVVAHDMALRRRRRLRKLVRLPELLTAVIEGLRLGWSLEQIAGRLRHDGAPHRVRHETIYQFAYSKEGRALELARLLPEGRRRRRPRGGRRGRDRQAIDTRSIKLRPDAVARREEFGHWEGDLLMFRKVFGKANVISLVERTSRYAGLLRNNDRQSDPIMTAVIDGFAALPSSARRTCLAPRCSPCVPRNVLVLVNHAPASVVSPELYALGSSRRLKRVTSGGAFADAVALLSRV